VGLLSDWEATLKDYLWLNFPPSLAAAHNWDAPLDTMLTAVHRTGDHALAQQIAEEVPNMLTCGHYLNVLLPSYENVVQQRKNFLLHILHQVKYDDPFDDHLYKVGEEMAKSFRALRLQRQGAGRDHWSCRGAANGSIGGNNGNGGEEGKWHGKSAGGHHHSPPQAHEPPSAGTLPHGDGGSKSGR